MEVLFICHAVPLKFTGSLEVTVLGTDDKVANNVLYNQNHTFAVCSTTYKTNFPYLYLKITATVSNKLNDGIKKSTLHSAIGLKFVLLPSLRL
jgi:hypothetical protein